MVREPAERRLPVTRHGIVHTGLDATSSELRADLLASGDTHDEQVINVARRRRNTGEPQSCAAKQLAVTCGQRDPPLRPGVEKG